MFNNINKLINNDSRENNSQYRIVLYQENDVFDIMKREIIIKYRIHVNIAVFIKTIQKVKRISMFLLINVFISLDTRLRWNKREENVSFE